MRLSLLLSLLLLSLALFTPSCGQPTVRVSSGDILLTPEQAADVKFDFGPDDGVRSVREIFEQLAALDSTIKSTQASIISDAIALLTSTANTMNEAINANSAALSSTATSLSNAVAASKNELSASISTVRSEASVGVSTAKANTTGSVNALRTEVNGYTDVKTTDAKNTASTSIVSLRTELKSYTDSKAVVSEKNANATALSLLADAMAKNPGSNGTVYDYVSNLIKFQANATATMSSLSARLSFVESLQVNPPRSCNELFTAGQTPASRLYDVYPTGTLDSRIQAYCHNPVGNAGWTVIASQPSALLGPVRDWYTRAAPTLVDAGVLGAYWKIDLKLIANEIYVENQGGQSYIFKTKDFTGPLIFDGANFVDASDNVNFGIIAGNNYPVWNHYQVGQACASIGVNCRVAGDSSAGYSYGVMAVFDWSNGDDSTTIQQHAHFGGNLNIESGWAMRGKVLMIR